MDKKGEIPKKLLFQMRKNLSHKRTWVGDHPTNRSFLVEEVLSIDLTKYDVKMEEERKLYEKESELLRSVHLNRYMRKERASIASCVKIVEFWNKNLIKRGEGLIILKKILAPYQKVSMEKNFVNDKIPELKTAFKLLKHLEKEMPNFTPDDYYLTFEEQIEEQYKFYESGMEGEHKEGWKKYFEDMEKQKEQIEGKYLKEGDKYVPFEYTNERGETISSENLLKKGPIVVSFFRGSWCPYCVNEMCVLADNLSRFEALNATLISFGPDPSSLKYFRRLGVLGEICVDTNLNVATKYGITFAPEENWMKFENSFPGLEYKPFGLFREGNIRVPVPATYVIDKSGVVALAYVKMEYYLRLEPSKIVRCLYDLFEKEEEMKGKDKETDISKKKSYLGKRKSDDITLDEEFRKIKKLRTFDHTKYLQS